MGRQCPDNQKPINDDQRLMTTFGITVTVEVTEIVVILLHLRVLYIYMSIQDLSFLMLWKIWRKKMTVLSDRNIDN